jgi:hypothetical protein
MGGKAGSNCALHIFHYAEGMCSSTTCTHNSFDDAYEDRKKDDVVAIGNKIHAHRLKLVVVQAKCIVIYAL